MTDQQKTEETRTFHGFILERRESKIKGVNNRQSKERSTEWITKAKVLPEETAIGISSTVL